jgi:broad specificity phosphatase PhoE
MSMDSAEEAGKIDPLSKGRIGIMAQRHDEHEQGHLTEKGREHARGVAEDTAKRVLDLEPNVHFMVIASDQVFDEREPGLGGQRARETAAIITTAIQAELKKRNLPPDQLFGDEFDESATISPTIREADIFVNGHMAGLKEQHPRENPWHLYYQDVDADIRIQAGAESPKSLARRMDKMFKQAEMVGASFHRTSGNEQKPLFIWVVGHGGGLDAYLHEYAGVPIEELGFGFSDGFSLLINTEGKMVAHVKGKEYVVHTSEEIEQP